MKQNEKIDNVRVFCNSEFPTLHRFIDNLEKKKKTLNKQTENEKKCENTKIEIQPKFDNSNEKGKNFEEKRGENDKNSENKKNQENQKGSKVEILTENQRNHKEGKDTSTNRKKLQANDFEIIDNGKLSKSLKPKQMTRNEKEIEEIEKKPFSIEDEINVMKSIFNNKRTSINTNSSFSNQGKSKLFFNASFLKPKTENLPASTTPSSSDQNISHHPQSQQNPPLHFSIPSSNPPQIQSSHPSHSFITPSLPPPPFSHPSNHISQSSNSPPIHSSPSLPISFQPNSHQLPSSLEKEISELKINDDNQEKQKKTIDNKAKKPRKARNPKKKIEKSTNKETENSKKKNNQKEIKKKIFKKGSNENLVRLNLKNRYTYKLINKLMNIKKNLKFCLMFRYLKKI